MDITYIGLRALSDFLSQINIHFSTIETDINEMKTGQDIDGGDAFASDYTPEDDYDGGGA